MYFFSGCLPQQELPKKNHALVQIEKEKVNLIWSKNDIYTIWNTFDTTIDALNNRVCFLGGLDYSTYSNIVCLSGNDGKVLWQDHSSNHESLAITPNAIFVIYSNSAGIIKYDTSGKVVWSKRLSGTGSDYLYIVGEQLQVLTIPEKFWVLDFDGNEINSIAGDKIFIGTSQGDFVESNGIKLVKTNSSEVIWQFQNLDDVLEMAPLFTETKVFVRTGQESGSIFTINRENGKLLWKTEDNIISNVVYSSANQAIYALTRDGNLLAINENNGFVDTIAKFSSVPFVLNGKSDVGSYQLTYDINENVLFVSLGDSRQLFAFKEE
jgi:outer membrane protein assembly factor BamB